MHNYHGIWPWITRWPKSVRAVCRAHCLSAQGVCLVINSISAHRRDMLNREAMTLSSFASMKWIWHVGGMSRPRSEADRDIPQAFFSNKNPPAKSMSSFSGSAIPCVARVWIGGGVSAGGWSGVPEDGPGGGGVGRHRYHEVSRRCPLSDLARWSPAAAEDCRPWRPAFAENGELTSQSGPSLRLSGADLLGNRHVCYD